MIFNRGKPRHARPRRPWATMLATLLTTIALVFVPGTALADSGAAQKREGLGGRQQGRNRQGIRCQLRFRESH